MGAGVIGARGGVLFAKEGAPASDFRAADARKSNPMTSLPTAR